MLPACTGSGCSSLSSRADLWLVVCPLPWENKAMGLRVTHSLARLLPLPLQNFKDWITRVFNLLRPSKEFWGETRLMRVHGKQKGEALSWVVKHLPPASHASSPALSPYCVSVRSESGGRDLPNLGLWEEDKRKAWTSGLSSRGVWEKLPPSNACRVPHLTVPVIPAVCAAPGSLINLVI